MAGRAAGALASGGLDGPLPRVGRAAHRTAGRARALAGARALLPRARWPGAPAPPSCRAGRVGGRGRRRIACRRWAEALLLGLALKPLLAWRMLRDEVLAVEARAGRLARRRPRAAGQAGQPRCARAGRSRGARERDRIAGREPQRFGGRAGVLVRAASACRARRSTASPTPPMRCGATAACARAASGNGPASGLRGPTTCSRGCPRASPHSCCSCLAPSRSAEGRGAGSHRAAKPATPRRPTAAGPWPPWRCCLGVRLAKPGVYVLNAAGASRRGATRSAPQRWRRGPSWLMAACRIGVDRCIAARRA